MYNRIIYILLCLLLVVLISNCSQSITGSSSQTETGELIFEQQENSAKTTSPSDTHYVPEVDSDKSGKNLESNFVPEVDSDKG